MADPPAPGAGADGPGATARDPLAAPPTAATHVPDDPRKGGVRLRAAKRLAYRAIVVPAFIAVLAFLLVGEADGGGAVDRAVAAALVVGLGLALVELVRAGGSLRRVEVLVLAVSWLALLGGLAAKLFGSADPAVHDQGWRDFAAWAPAVYFWGTFALGRRVGLRASLAFFAVAVLVLVAHVSQGDAVPWRAWSPFFVASLAYVPGIQAFAWFLERQARALAAAEAVADRAYVDLLTGLPNRWRFVDRLEHAVRVADRTGRGFAVAFLDLDGFKAVNDAYGHQAGDALLQGVAKRLAATVRASDTIARFSGDEFTVLTGAEIDDTGLRALGDRLLAACAAPVGVAGRSLRVSASVGLVRFPEHARDAEGLLRAADAAMYAAKWSGAGKVQVGPVGGASRP